MTTTTPRTLAQQPWEPALSVRQVLGLERVRAGQPEVVAGAHRLDRPVRWVHVAEAADVGVMLSGGEMVLTTGVLLAGDEEGQGEYIRSLDRAEAAAVVLGLGRAFPAPPEVMRSAAERCGLPMVVLHRPFPFAELTEEVQSRLLRRKFAAVSLSEAVRTELTGLITAGAPVQRLLDEVARHAGCPVVVTNLAHRALATAGERAAVDDVLRDWERIARQAGAGSADGWIRAELTCRGEGWGRLVLCGYRGERAAGRLLADRAAEALVLHRMLAGDGTHPGVPAGSRDSWEEQSARSLLTDLVSGAVPARQLLPRARAAGLPVNRRVFVPLVVREREPARPARVLRRLGLPGLAARLADDHVAVLLSLAPDQDARALTAHFATRLRAEPDNSHAVVAAADARADWTGVPAGLREAQHVADAVADSPAAALDLPPVVRLRDIHLRGLVRLLRDDPHVQSFAERELDGLLRGPDRDLLPVLRTYLATGRNKSRTAQLHHVSRPALYRRLEAIQGSLGVDLDDFEQAASVHIALLAHDAQQG
ncbi:DNA-binding protein [Streptomyces anthocyanicus]|uniref:DNA-binding protein n=2 Tax=Streptomyces TaxID=1883 RepID=O69807_STRCO|nr:MULTISPECIES: PucR family transcriptional regulator [Streptomyces]MDX2923939.1 PucR family transcriptional regulator [Streptomyces sp. NRRL_B-16638]MDX3369069.1 PucR family transcriptional regulator [Streptomyces sp. ME02-6987-2C]MDX3409240.1 PucR family transcriptional regulator [Streptomyces sp. ME02-6977A]MDX3421537.1 PucR family transcriptional regulator [Streptomyces sp. ME02-6985-2c]MYU45916.1 PucR family transcriptional regulator [Streptomyces sp. SID7813]